MGNGEAVSVALIVFSAHLWRALAAMALALALAAPAAAVKLTRRGARALRHARRLRVTLLAAFTPAGGTVTRRSRALTLR